MKNSWGAQNIDRPLRGLVMIVAATVASNTFATATHASPPAPPAPPPFGVPLQGLSSSQLTDFKNGISEFQDKETVSSGLGPIFNNVSCISRHSGPAIGGSSPISTTRFGQVTNGVFDPLASLGGSLLQSQAIKPNSVEVIPKQANVTAHRQTPPLYGAGLIEAIPDSTILAGVRTTPVNGVLGRAAMIQDIVSGQARVGRFGWKAQQATLLAFAGDAYVNEIGITNRLYPTENAPNGNVALLKQLDTVPDPEDHPDPGTGKAGIDRLADFMRYLAPPPPQPMNASTTFGAKFFATIGCTNCHTPMMTTSSNAPPPLNSRNMRLFSDLLLHDMGSLGDGIAQGAAHPHEMKTPPLWGLRASGPYLHDGRAQTIDGAIRAHDGEAKSSVTQYLNLTSDQQSLLIQFLNSI